MTKNIILLCVGLLILGCETTDNTTANQKESMTENVEAIKKAIEATLKQETKYFCERNLEMWQIQWSHEPFVSKMYAGEKDFEQFTTWEEINAFTENHIAENPNKIPIPETNYDLDIHILGETAWVFYSKTVDDKNVRETRFMVKEGDKWKIARMQTVY